jgi:hypothetical protein
MRVFAVSFEGVGLRVLRAADARSACFAAARARGLGRDGELVSAGDRFQVFDLCKHVEHEIFISKDSLLQFLREE